MREVFKRIMQLQNDWSHANTVEMQERGQLIRDVLPTWLRSYQEILSKSAGIEAGDFSVTGRDGTGRKTQIPWVRFYSTKHSPSPTNGWYCVYLFNAIGSEVYLALAHGSTRFINGEFKPRGLDEVRTLVDWAGNLLFNEVESDPKLAERIQLDATSKLGEAYASSTVAAIKYTATAFPSESTLISDARKFARMLGKLYGAEVVGKSPESGPPELVAALEALQDIANPLRLRAGQGFGLSSTERKAVELRAMAIASEYWKEQGYKVRDVSVTDSYDLEVTNEKSRIYVEVKGTTAGPSSIMLTANEVALHQYHYPNNALIVVHSIILNRTTNPPMAEGGTILCIHPWEIEKDALTALSYKYNLII